ncbi:MAG: hypothetical protein WB992_17160 [Bryobacteraceae bacterium]
MPFRGASLLLALACLVSLPAIQADTVVGVGSGGNIPSNAPLASAGTFTSNAAMSGEGIVASGNAATVVLRGFEHDWSGDLIATLSYINSSGATVASANLFYRIGMTSAQPDGAWAQFGADGTGDNYTFNSAFTRNIWTVAAGLGSADVIPGLQTDPVNGGEYSTSDANGVKNSFSSAFAGLHIAMGTWKLTITDASSHASEGGGIGNTGSLTGWEVDIQTVAPSASYMVSATPSSRSLVAGTSVTYTVTVSPVNGFTGSTNLTVSGLPRGASGVFTPNLVSISKGAVTSTLMLSTAASVPAGSYPLTISAQTGSVVRSTTATLAVTAPPLSFTVTPSSGSGSSQSFTFTYFNPAGVSNYTQAQVLINSNDTSGVNTCNLIYEPPSNALYLMNDADSQLLGPVTPGGSGKLSNDQCSVPASSVTVSSSPTALTLSAGINFTSSFAGSQEIYMLTFDNHGTRTGWLKVGSWTVP